MLFSDLLTVNDIDPNRLAIVLHKPGNEFVRRAVCEAAENAPALFDAYQSTHAAGAEATLDKRPLLASFVSGSPGELTFVGIYEKFGYVENSPDHLRSDANFMSMLDQIGEPRSAENFARLGARKRFDLGLCDTLSDLKGRLIVADPGGRNIMRLAENAHLQVVEMSRRATLVPDPPHWTKLTLTAVEVRNLPRSWALQLAAWRGIYLIVDENDGARYVGSAYGSGNLLARWQTHVAKPKGVTKELTRRGTDRFRFSILELLAPSATVDEVTQLEQTWMDRLHTRVYGLNA